MEPDVPQHDPRPRRRLLVRAGAFLLAAALLLAACGDEPQGTPPSAAAMESGSGDVALLERLLERERMTVAAYGALGGAGRASLELGRRHADGLARTIRDLGGRPRRAGAASELPRPDGRRDALRSALRLERAELASYAAALPRLQGPQLRGLAATIATSEAEQASVLLAELGEEPLPSAFALPGPGAVRAAGEADAAVLRSVLELEDLAVFGHGQVLASARLGPGAARTIRRVRDQDRRHAGALRGAVRAGEATLAPEEAEARERTRAARRAEVTEALRGARTRQEVLEVAIGREAQSVAALRDACSRLDDPRLLRGVLSMMAADGQHLAALRTATGLPALTGAFETGER